MRRHVRRIARRTGRLFGEFGAAVQLAVRLTRLGPLFCFRPF
jgi:hypothetical protein